MNNNKGSALLLVIGVVAILIVLCGGYSLRIINESSIARKNVYSTQAFWISEAGIQAAAWDYAYNQCRGMSNAGTGALCTDCLSCGSGARLYTGNLDNGSYRVTINPVTRTYISTGSVWRGSGDNRILLGQRKIKMIFGQSYLFGYGAFAQGSLEISNNSHIDSYNSNNGPYGSQAPRTNGNVGTNGSSVNIVDIGNNSVIRGAVSTGPGGTIDYNANKVTITGGVTHTNDIYIDSVSIPTDLQTATYQVTPTVSNGAINLTAGSYRFNNIAIGNNQTLNVSGEVKIYLMST
nr:hypothetical protein [Candidatus Omnitrophota bacterium]